jgi:hypothetical protein
MTAQFANPLRPLWIPFALRSLFLVVGATSILFGAAPQITAGMTGNSAEIMLTSLLLLSIAIWDGVRAFRTRVGLPGRSIGMGGIACDDRELCNLMRSSANPNDRYLSWLGMWAARVSERFAGLPSPFQRLTEIAITAIAFSLAAALVVALCAGFGIASGKASESFALLGWLWYWFAIQAYVFWWTMLGNCWLAARWARKLTANGIIAVLAFFVLVLAAVGFAAQTSLLDPKNVPKLGMVSAILVLGSVWFASIVLRLARLRSTGMRSELRCSRITVSDTIGVHPQSVPSAFASVLAQTRSGSYHELCDSSVSLQEQHSTAAGLFGTLFAGEYGASLNQVGPSDGLRRFGTFVGITGISLGGLALGLMGVAACGVSTPLWGSAWALLLFGELTVLVAYYPLSEIRCESYLLSLKIDGSYQRRGGAAGGGIHTDYILDGGIARATSVSFVRASMASFALERVIESTVEDDSEREVVMTRVRQHLKRAATSDRDNTVTE